MDDHRNRCAWAGTPASLMRDYHDREWGVPLHDDRALFEFLCLEGAQAGLSWRTVLDKRAAYRKAFANFDIAHCARLTDAHIEKLMLDAGIIRNRQKIVAVRDNACATLQAIEEFGSLDAYLWSFVDGKSIRNHWRGSGDVPATSAVSEHMSRQLRRRGFGFIGPTICYAFMQATGMVNDHTVGCFRHRQITN
ncbi:MAG: DNA-3-methyladenine glycosylase I [Rhodanobacter sp.]|nr:DNA-3-methyladenine glycosylase I [Rhodanobacter sp.]